MELVSVYDIGCAWIPLYDILKERESFESISHKSMPTQAEHCAFIRSEPYEAWYCLIVDEVIVGCAYLTRQREIGISILKAHRGLGYGKLAIKLLMELHPGKFLANVAPGNQKSIDLFAKLGFNLIQHTYSHE